MPSSTPLFWLARAEVVKLGKIQPPRPDSIENIGVLRKIATQADSLYHMCGLLSFVRYYCTPYNLLTIT